MTRQTRFPTHTPDTARGAAATRLTELWTRHDGEVSTMVRTMAGSPSLLNGYLDLSRAMKRSRLSRRIAEQISVAIQARLGCSVCLAAHVHAARAAGLDDGDIALAIAGHAADPAAAELVTFALDVLSEPASIDEQRIAVLRTHGHDDRTLLDVIGLVSLNHLTGAFNLVAGLELEHTS